MEMAAGGKIVEVDDRRRVTLGSLGVRAHSRYLAHADDDGTIVLTPAVVMTARQASFISSDQGRAVIADAMSRLDEAVDAPRDLAALIDSDDND